MISYVLSLWPESQRLQAVSMSDRAGLTVLHHAANADNFESIKLVLYVYPEPQRLQVVNTQDDEGKTVLHAAVESYQSVLKLLDSSESSHNKRLHSALQLTEQVDIEQPEAKRAKSDEADDGPEMP